MRFNNFMVAISFRVENQKALRLAECTSIPRLMIICGANGSGKSTLLWALMRHDGLVLEGGNTQVLYQSPHRAIRSTTVQRRWLGGARNSYSSGLEGQSVAVPEGMSIPNPSRSPDNIDESGSTIKYSLGKLENRRHAYLASMHDAARKSGASSIDISQEIDVFAPLAILISRLLPHLEFHGVDFSNEDNIRIGFTRRIDHQDPIELDLNDLSSGEKAVILLFLPLVESEIIRKLDLMTSSGSEDVSFDRDRLFLLDEPELHLHPDLQRRMLAYMRERSTRDNIQFILITHSPTILDQANDEELYVLTPSSQNGNQLQQAASPVERLEALRELTGESYFLSTGRNIVCCEGENGFIKGKVTDRSLIELFNLRSSRYTFIPMGGKSQVIEAVGRLRESLPVEKYGVAVVGLIDADQSSSLIPGCITWPFCEIENALIHPKMIRDAINRHFESSAITEEEVVDLIKMAGEELREDEIRLRIARELGTQIFRPNGTDLDSVQTSYAEFLAKCEIAFDSSIVSEVCTKVIDEVSGQLTDGSFVRRFRGKKLLKLIFNSLNLQNFSFARFCYLLAGRVREEAELTRELDLVFSQIDAMVDEQLLPLLAEISPLDEIEGQLTNDVDT